MNGPGWPNRWPWSGWSGRGSRSDPDQWPRVGALHTLYTSHLYRTTIRFYDKYRAIRPVYDYYHTAIGIYRADGKWSIEQTSFSTQWTTEALLLHGRPDTNQWSTRYYMAHISALLFVNSNSQVSDEKGTCMNETKFHISPNVSGASIAAKVPRRTRIFIIRLYVFLIEPTWICFRTRPLSFICRQWPGLKAMFVR